jgi:hypothetical protein
VETATLTETIPGLAINEGASLFWATFYEKGFGELADRGNVGLAVLGGAAVAMLAYLTDQSLQRERWIDLDPTCGAGRAKGVWCRTAIS